LAPKLELKLESESEQGLKHSCPEGLPATAGLTGVREKLLNHIEHGKYSLLHLLYMSILPLSDSVKQASKPLICCGMVTSCLQMKLSKSGL
jgi:hypothetical protein